MYRDPEIVYVYSNESRIFHDKHCPEVLDIPNEDLRTMSKFPQLPGILWCSSCYRMALIRAGIKVTEQYRITSYQRVLDQANISNEDLYELLVENKAKLLLVEYNIMEITLGEDIWRLVIGRNNSIKLMHNNYTILAETRYGHANEEKNFHEHTFALQTQDSTIHQMIQNIIKANWRNHLAPKAKMPSANSAMTNTDIILLSESRKKKRKWEAISEKSMTAKKPKTSIPTERVGKAQKTKEQLLLDEYGYQMQQSEQNTEKAGAKSKKQKVNTLADFCRRYM